MHKVLVKGFGGLSLPRKSVARLTDCPDMTLDVYRGRKTTQYNTNGIGSLIAQTILKGLFHLSLWRPKPNSTVLEKDVNIGKSYVSNSASASQTYPNLLHKLYRNQSNLKINLIDMNGV